MAGPALSLVSETRGTRLPNTVTNAEGEFAFLGATPGAYRLEISQKGFDSRLTVKSGEARPFSKCGTGTFRWAYGSDTVQNLDDRFVRVI